MIYTGSQPHPPGSKPTCPRAVAMTCMTSPLPASAPILCVGLVCLDIINLCDHYPLEDEDIRARDQQWRSGGNAANTSIVLSLLGRRMEFMGTLGSGMETEWVWLHGPVVLVNWIPSYHYFEVLGRT